MYCSECGEPVGGKFCSNCGHALHAETVPVELVVEWDREIDYKTLMGVREVRETVDRYAGMARKKMTGEEFLALADKIVPMGVPMENMAALINPLARKMGVRTGQERVERIDAPIGRVMVRALCSLARRGQPIRNVNQGTDGCSLEASLPSDVWALEGDLVVTVRRRDRGADVSGATRIHGQWFDWGKSRRCLDDLFDDLRHDPA